MYFAADEPDFDAALNGLHAAKAALTALERDLLRGKEPIRWRIVGISDGSLLTDIRPDLPSDVSLADVDLLCDTWVSAYRWFVTEDHAPSWMKEGIADRFRELGRAASQGGLRGFATASVTDPTEATDFSVEPLLISPEEALPAEEPYHRYIGSLVGKIDQINRHTGRKGALWDDLYGRRVSLRYPADMHNELVEALHEEGTQKRRVEVSGEITVDSSGRPVSIEVTELDVIPPDDALPTLTSLIGAAPGLREGQDAAVWLDRHREGDELAG
jgi:hypothetical protein